jgi:hypothetical protein
MRFYPFGSGSSATIQSSSFADYAEVTRFASLVLSASFALSGSIGPRGQTGSCIPVDNPGDKGFTGDPGPIGTASLPI